MGDFISDHQAPPTTCFSCTRLNRSTFKIVEDDKYHEYPFIYVKITEHVLVLIDTGCGGATDDKKVELTSLRAFLETYPVESNEHAPLNEHGFKDYVVICSHCHYDHIGAVEQFTDERSCIWASSYDKSFLSPENLPTSSLCRFLDIPTPQYKITKWADDGTKLQHKDDDLGLVFFQTPGHVPDELAIWDPAERVLFVGDSLYEWAPIIFPKEGNLVTFVQSMTRLRTLVDGWNESPRLKRVTIACGHCTDDTDAADLLRHVDQFVWNVVDGKEEIKQEENSRGEIVWTFEQEDGRLSMRTPKRLVDELRSSNTKNEYP